MEPSFARTFTSGHRVDTRIGARRTPDNAKQAVACDGFTRLLAHMATIVRTTVRSTSARIGEATFTLTTPPNTKQQQALDLLTAIALSQGFTRSLQSQRFEAEPESCSARKELRA